MLHWNSVHARQVLLGGAEGAHFNIPKLRFNNEIISASGSYTDPYSEHFST